MSGRVRRTNDHFTLKRVRLIFGDCRSCSTRPWRRRPLHKMLWSFLLDTPTGRGFGWRGRIRTFDLLIQSQVTIARPTPAIERDAAAGLRRLQAIPRALGRCCSSASRSASGSQCPQLAAPDEHGMDRHTAGCQGAGRPRCCRQGGRASTSRLALPICEGRHRRAIFSPVALLRR